jgi:tRNA(Glu) U13 pseudouridine synthase TruD
VVGDLVSQSKHLLDQPLLSPDEGSLPAADHDDDLVTQTEEVVIHVVTEDDIANSRYTIRDVVLPLVGRNTRLPEHQTGEYIRSLLLERGLSLGSINGFERSGVRSCIRGHYRRIIEYPEAFTYRLARYTSPNETIQQNEINTLPLLQREEHGIASATAALEETEAKRLALVIEFNLSPGSYATMLLRELMKEVTDASYHAELTAATAVADATRTSSSPGGDDAVVAVGEKRRSEEVTGSELEEASKRPAREVETTSG